MPAQEYPFAKALNNCFIYTKMGAYQPNSAMASVYSQRSHSIVQKHTLQQEHAKHVFYRVQGTHPENFLSTCPPEIKFWSLGLSTCGHNNYYECFYLKMCKKFLAVCMSGQQPHASISWTSPSRYHIELVTCIAHNIKMHLAHGQLIN